MLCNQSLELFIFYKIEILHPLNNNLPFPHYLYPLATIILLYEFDYSKHFIEYPDSYTICLLVTSIVTPSLAQHRPGLLLKGLGVGGPGSALYSAWIPTTWNGGGRHGLVLKSSPSFQGLIPVPLRGGWGCKGGRVLM